MNIVEDNEYLDKYCELAVEMADNIVEIVKDVKQKYIDTHKPIINKVAEKIMKDVLVNVLKKNFMMEMENNNE